MALILLASNALTEPAVVVMAMPSMEVIRPLKPVRTVLSMPDPTALAMTPDASLRVPMAALTAPEALLPIPQATALAPVADGTMVLPGPTNVPP